MALAACGGGGGGGVSSTPTPPTTSAPTPTPTPAPTPTPTPTPTASYDTAEYQRSNAASAAKAISAYQSGATGAGITVGVIDSGINSSLSEFAGRISTNSRDVASTRGMADESGHGTAVAAVIAAAKNDQGIAGVAYDANLIIARTDDPGSCANADGCTHYDNDLARGIDLAIANNARVINISLGGDAMTSTLRAAIDRATAAGTVIVISAGNDGETAEGVNPDPFAMVALDGIARGQVIIAGAIDSNGAIAGFSNRAGTGASQYLTALGVRVRSIDETGTTLLFNGTSFATPVISGAVALLAQAFPNLTGKQIVDLLFRTARDAGAAGDDAVYGQGVIDLARAFQPQGALSVAGTSLGVDSITGTASTAIGDGGQQGQSLSTVALDDLGRAYNVALGSGVSAASRAPGLASALRPQGRVVSATAGAAAVSLSIADAGAGGTPLRLTTEQAREARATAGFVTGRIDQRTQIALGISTSADSVAERLKGQVSPAFLIADATTRPAGFGGAAGTSMALRRMIAGYGVTASAERGDVRLYEPGSLRALRNEQQRYGYDRVAIGADRRIGGLSLGLEASRLNERHTVLGARFGSAYGGGGSVSWFLDANASLDAGDGWRFGGAYRQGTTKVRGGGLLDGGTLVSNAFSLDAFKHGLLSRGDQFALRLSQPLRVSHGGLKLILPTGYDYETLTPTYAMQRMDLSPRGRQIDVEAAYGSWFGPGWLSTNLYLRRESGNLAYAPDDLGGAVRWSFAF